MLEPDGLQFGELFIIAPAYLLARAPRVIAILHQSSLGKAFDNVYSSKKPKRLLDERGLGMIPSIGWSM